MPTLPTFKLVQMFKKLLDNSKSFYLLKKFITKSTKISFSLGLDCAMSKVTATSVLLSITCLFSIYKILLNSKKYINKVAAILLLPSIKV